jgi:hypothetical protein
MPHESEQEKKPGVSFVAIRKDVVRTFEEWESESPRLANVVSKFLALAEALVCRDPDLVNHLLKRNDVDPIKDCSGLVELGPKRQKGGAPRLFLFRRADGAFFVAAGIEKGSKGVKEMATARDRAGALREIRTYGITPEAVARTLGSEWTVLWEGKMPTAWWAGGRK